MFDEKFNAKTTDSFLRVTIRAEGMPSLPLPVFVTKTTLSRHLETKSSDSAKSRASDSQVAELHRQRVGDVVQPASITKEID